MENKGFILFDFIPPGGWNICWYCGNGGEGFARYEMARTDAGRILIANVCPACMPRAERGDRSLRNGK